VVALDRATETAIGVFWPQAAQHNIHEPFRAPDLWLSLRQHIGCNMGRDCNRG
jgi:hypothetical protein